MPRYVAFLRAINVGGHVVTMAKLKALFEAVPLAKVETFIASGNVIFESRTADPTKLERAIEKRLREGLGYEVTTFLRTDAEIAAIAAHKPFPEAALKSAKAFVVGFASEPLGTRGDKLLKGFETDDETFRTRGRELYWMSRVGQGKSEFSAAKLEKALGARVTFRGMNTVQRLAAKYPAAGG
jgi:uncharacterized protein (DUF1697 family)